jgi:hypothetical protein
MNPTTGYWKFWTYVHNHLCMFSTVAQPVALLLIAYALLTK